VVEVRLAAHHAHPERDIAVAQNAQKAKSVKADKFFLM